MNRRDFLGLAAGGMTILSCGAPGRQHAGRTDHPNILLILLNACWLATVPFTLPGNWLMVMSAYLFAWWQWERDFCG